MTEEQLVQFYNLCQAYRHTPIVPQSAVIHAYEGLVDFVNSLIKTPESGVKE